MAKQTVPIYLDTRLIRASSLQETLLQTLNFLEQLMPGGNKHSIVLWNSETETFDMGASTVQMQPPGTTANRVRRKKGATRWIVDHRKPFIVSDVKDDPFGANPMLIEYGIQGYCGVPLLFEGVAIGVLYTLWMDGNIYDTNAIELLQGFANFITITIANIRLTDELSTANQTIYDNHNQLQTIFDTIPDQIYIKDTAGHFIKVNNWSVSQYGVTSSDEIIGKTDFDFYPEHQARDFDKDDRNIIQTGEALVNQEELRINSQGIEEWMLTNKAPLRDSDGKIIGIVGTSRSITSRKIVEKQRQKLESERQHIAILNSFIGNVAHDFKTPLSVINTNLYLLQRKHGDLIGDRLDVLQTQTGRLSKLVDDMLEMSRLDAVETLKFITSNIVKIIEDVVNSFQSQALANQQDLRFKTAQDVLTLPLAPDAVAIALSRIVENALQHNPPGTQIEIVAEMVEDNAHITVSDTGIGISTEDAKAIFERFYRVDDSRNINTGGTGLGLAIARKYIELHNGRIEVDSKIGEGSHFKIYLPLNHGS